MTTTKDGNAVLLPEEDYSGIVETLYLVSVPGMRKSSWRPRPNRWKIVLTNRLWNGSHQDFKPFFKFF